MKKEKICENNCESKKDYQKVADFLKIINESNRLKILCLLRNKELCVCEIWQFLNLPQNLTSHHLKILKDFKLISSKQKGRKIMYKLNKTVIQKYISFLNNFLIQNL